MDLKIIIELIKQLYLCAKKKYMKAKEKHFQIAIDRCVKYIQENKLFVSHQELTEILSEYITEEDLKTIFDKYYKKVGKENRKSKKHN